MTLLTVVAKMAVIVICAFAHVFFMARAKSVFTSEGIVAVMFLVWTITFSILFTT